MVLPLLVTLTLLLSSGTTQNLPTNYEYYTSGGISSGLNADQSYFVLNGKNFSLYSGAMHYFRVPRGYWRDRLQKLRAAGLNTVETYIAWNLHEPENGVFDFGEGGSEMEDFLHLEELLTTAKEEDLFVILRSGPYICAEYNFGGFPSWLLREERMGFRTTEETYMKYVTRYFNTLLPILAKYQFTKGGPIIAFQVENEYGNQEYQTFLPQKEYLEELHQLFVQNSIVELLVTSDSPLSHQDKGTLPGVFLQTANLGASPEKQFEKLLELQPNRPLMVMEFWIGWFDFWGNDHATRDANTMKGIYERILTYPASVNIYMFHGGTNFGFTNGASLGNTLFDNSGFEPITTSYDYDSPLTESGDYTDKYFNIRELLIQHSPVKTYTPDVPNLNPKIAYPVISIEKEILLSNLIQYDAPYVIESENVVAMEKLDINGNSGQSYGYIVYRKENVDLAANTVLKIGGHICDTAVVSVNGVRVSPSLETKNDLDGFGFWRLADSTLVLTTDEKKGATVDILVENWGRINGGKITQYNQTFKGLWQGDVYLNDNRVSGWKIIPLEFKKSWTNNLEAWSSKTSSLGPALYYASLEISDEPSDTYIDMRSWTKGLVVVNGIPLGKYAKIGPQQALYLPAPFLKKGYNSIIVFEHYKSADQLSFTTGQIWKTA
ncbi:beta-galactosidase-1-like protein 3 [Anoplophora glabripennis]|uniref:beta-galactosidase-1-like protein 3 n=1 Tax=Anoplophora glabripennis TaxID=217634 RepID=UPI000874F5C4|nr:beta-galactosidase-1-like protein 3 [Anoplophora glabripennis]